MKGEKKEAMHHIAKYFLDLDFRIGVLPLSTKEFEGNGEGGGHRPPGADAVLNRHWAGQNETQDDFEMLRGREYRIGQSGVSGRITIERR